MDEAALARTIATQVVADTRFWIALIGLLGGIAGALLTLFGNVVLHWLKEKPKRELDKKRKAILKEMLDDNRFAEKWRNLDTLSAVIGACEKD